MTLLISVPSFYFGLYFPAPFRVADYDQRIEIWSNSIAGNHNGSKLEDMEINYNTRFITSSLALDKALTGSYRDEEQTIDSFTYAHSIKTGIEKQTYQDIPYLIPYTVENGQGAVIIVCGGGFAKKNIATSTSEGKDVAITLNKHGINAFVLYYRSNPYQMPIPQLDLQRAIRYLKASASTLGINSSQIGLIGFSAGGYQIGSFINQIQNNNLFPSSYTPDDVDNIDASVSFAAMIYPFLTYKYNMPMLFSSFDSSLIKNDRSRASILAKTHLPSHFSSTDVDQFICYGTADNIVNYHGTEEYIETAINHGANIVVSKNNYNHGFSQKYYMPQLLDFIDDCWQ